MNINYTTKQKYLDNAPHWDIDGHAPTSVVHDTHYTPQNAERREPDALDSDLLFICLVWSLVGAVVMASIVYWAM